jgi:alcohol dehydrogenase class IV
VGIFNFRAAGEISFGAGSIGDAAVLAVGTVKRLAKDLGVPQRLSDLGIPETAIPGMAKEAMKVARPLENNPRPVSMEEATRIYHSVFYILSFPRREHRAEREILEPYHATTDLNVG